jgi:hypothetical protein
MMTMTDAIPKQLFSAVSLKATENFSKNENDIKHDSDDDADDATSIIMTVSSWL